MLKLFTTKKRVATTSKVKAYKLTWNDFRYNKLDYTTCKPSELDQWTRKIKSQGHTNLKVEAIY